MAAPKKGPIKPLNPAHKGEFTAKAKAAGMSVSAYAAKVLKPGSTASASTKRQANFARNAKGWSHAAPKKAPKGK